MDDIERTNTTTKEILANLLGSEAAADELVKAADVVKAANAPSEAVEATSFFKFLSGDFALTDVTKLFSGMSVDLQTVRQSLANNPLLRGAIESFLDSRPGIAKLAAADISSAKFNDILTAIKEAPQALDEARGFLNNALDIVEEYLG